MSFSDKLYKWLGLTSNEASKEDIIKINRKTSKVNPTLHNCKNCGSNGEIDGKCAYCGSGVYKQYKLRKITNLYAHGIEPVSFGYGKISSMSQIMKNSDLDI